MASMLEGMVDKVVQVVTNDGRNIVGVLKGFDQTTNIILDECHERVFSSDAGVEQVVLGLYIVRGDNMCVLCRKNSPFLSFLLTRLFRSLPQCCRWRDRRRCRRRAFAGRDYGGTAQAGNALSSLDMPLPS